MSASKKTNLIHSDDSSIELDYVSTHTRSEKTLRPYKVGERNCRLCDMSFGMNKTLYQAHFNVHQRESILLQKEDGIEKLTDDEEDILESTRLVRLSYQSGKCKLTCRSGRITSSVSMQLENCSSRNIQLTDVFLFNDAVALPVTDVATTLAPGEKLDFLLMNAAQNAQKINDFVLRYLELPLRTELIEVHRLQRCCFSTGNLRSKAMIEYKSDFSKMRSIVENQKGKAVVPCPLNPSNYIQTLKQFIQLEEYANDLELQSFNCQITLTKLTLKPLSMPSKFSITIPNVKTKFPKLKEMDRFWMRPKGDNNMRNHVHATITDIHTNEIHIIVRKKEPIVNETYKIEFILNRSQIQTEHRALDTMHSFELIKFMFPAPLPPLTAACSQITNLQWYNENIKKNSEQHEAVLSIVNGVSYPAPYLIFGPPGTGKTATITEAICQLLRTQPNSRILVTATSNTAADELAQRLLKYLRSDCYFHHNVYRLYAANVQREVTDAQLLAHSNYQLSSIPAWEILLKYRILICTLATSGRLNLAPPFQSAKHFTHLFIDECGSATETAALIPIAVCSSMGKINVNVILSGDPKQLGPVIISKTAEKMGYGESLIARLMNRDSYKRNPFSKTYCKRMLTQLVRNFRSHPNIINISNALFYDNELLACAPIEKANCYLGWSKLPVKNVPILFDVTVGTASKEENSTSWFNNKEVKKVIQYVNFLLKNNINGKRITADDIGIISPYTRQCQKIEMVLRQCGHKIMTSSVELFQGKEKPVIIVSTVRTGRQGIGFLDSPQRLNVLLTRAQSLMILIGDPNVLQKDANWYDVLKHLSKLNVMIGTEFVMSARRPPSSIEAENTCTVPNPKDTIHTGHIRPISIPTYHIRPVPSPIDTIRPVPIIPRQSISSVPISKASVTTPTVPIPRQSFRSGITLSHISKASVPSPTDPISPVPIPRRRSFRSVPNSTVPIRPVPDPIDYESFRRRLAISTANSPEDVRQMPNRIVDGRIPKKPVAAESNGCCLIL